MPDEKSKRPDPKMLLLGAASAGVASGLAGLASKAFDKKQKTVTHSRELKRKRGRLARKQRDSQVPKARHPKAIAADSARTANPKAYKATAKAQRLARRASVASGRGLGVGGLLAGAATNIRDAASIHKEGGSFPARFGKLVETLTGFPSGSSRRPLTDKEKKDRHST